jgi:HAD superfamily hydrolase (TIGR01549 family)
VIRAIVFDVGYTIIDEARQWASWARELGVTQTAFMQVLRSVIAERRHHRDVFARLRPEFDLKAALARREGLASEIWTENDLYPEARSALLELKAKGAQIGLAGNQPPQAKRALERLNLSVDWIANSAELGIEKPAPEFFTRLAAKTGCEPRHIAYVGDRLDNDVLPAQAAGMRGVFLVRGPWGEAHAAWPEAAQAHMTIHALSELTALWRETDSVQR